MLRKLFDLIVRFRARPCLRQGWIMPQGGISRVCFRKLSDLTVRSRARPCLRQGWIMPHCGISRVCFRKLSDLSVRFRAPPCLRQGWEARRSRPTQARRAATSAEAGAKAECWTAWFLAGFKPAKKPPI